MAQDRWLTAADLGSAPSPRRGAVSTSWLTADDVAPPTAKRDQVDDETAFRQWATSEGVADPDAPESFYDYRAAYRAGAGPDATGHWPSQFKLEGHPDLIVGGFDTRTGRRVPGTQQASESELVRLGWAPEDAKHLSALPKPPSPTLFETREITPPLKPGERAGYERVTGKPTPVPAFGESIIDTPLVGVVQVARGATKLAGQLARPTVQSGEPHVMAGRPDDAAAQQGAIDVLDGSMKALTPLLVGSAFVAPIRTALLVGTATAAGVTAREGMLRAGADAQSAALVQSIVSTAVGAGMGKALIESLDALGAKAVEGAKAAARPVVLASKLTSSGFGVGDVPGARLTPYADAAASRPNEVIELTRQPGEAGDAARAALAEQEAAARPTTPAPSVVTEADLAGVAPEAPPAVQRLRRDWVRQNIEEGRAAGVQPGDVAQRLEAERQAIERRAVETPATPVRESGWKDQTDVVEAPPEEPRKFSSTQIDLPADVATTITNLARQIPDEDLADKGREDAPHITVKFGLHTDDVEKVREVLKDEPPITVTLGKTSLFPPSESSGNADVVKVDVDSPDLHRLNAKIADALDTTDTHPDYQPHVTVAYVKAGSGKKYEGWIPSGEGTPITINAITFSSKSGETITIPLTGKSAAAPAGPAVGDRVTFNLGPRAAVEGEVRELVDTRRGPRVRLWFTDPKTGRGMETLRDIADVRTASPAAADVADAPPARTTVATPNAPSTQAPRVALTDIPRDVAVRAHAGTSMDPEQRGAGEQQGYVEHMNRVWADLSANATTPEQQAIAASEFERFRSGYLARTLDQLRRRSGLVSTMIAGPAKFPVRQMEKKNAAYDKRRTAFVEWETRAIRAMTQAVAPAEATSISADRPDAPDRLQHKIRKAQDLQTLMKAANAIVRRKGLSENEKVAQLVQAVQISETAARKLLEPDFAGRLGFPDYELTNNAANIRRMQARVGVIQQTRGREELSATFDGGTVEENAGANRIQISFDAKPAPAMRDRLKAAGFKWAPSAGVWQRQRTDAAVAATERLLGVTLRPTTTEPTIIEGSTHEGTAATQTGSIPPDRGEERPAAPRGGPEPRGQRQARRAARESTVARETALLETLVSDARAGGYTGDEAVLRRELADRLQLIKDLDTEFDESGHNPQALLKAIAGYGGISVKAESGLKGELRWLKEFQTNVGTTLHPRAAFGIVAGVRGVFNEKGLSVDDMLTSLRQEPRFAYLETLDDLLEEVRAAAMADPIRLASEQLREGLGERWWERLGTVAEGSDAVEPEDGGDATFNPDEFTGASDVLDTGEVQPRLPEAGAVREQDIATPQFEAPFSLTADADTAPKERQRSIFDDSDSGDHEMRVPEGVQVPIKEAIVGLREAGQSIRTTLTAPSVSHPARLSSRALRYRIAQMMHTLSYANHALAQYRNAVEGLTVDHAAILDLADQLEGVRGAKPLPSWLQPWAAIRTDIFDYLKKQIADLGIEKEWKAHYLGHVWETEFKEGERLPRTALDRLIGRRPLQGPKTFLKRRTIPTMREGVETFGKEPKTWNLVDLDLYKIQEMSTFILGRRALEDNTRMGTWVFQTALKRPPAGMVAIPDPIGQVWAPPEITVHEAYDKLLMEGLENFIRGLGVTYTRATGAGKVWGASEKKTGNISARFGGPEGVLMHEVGHTLDTLYGLWDRISTRLKTPEFEGETSALKELRALAALRYEGLQTDATFKRYVQKRPEQIANLVHAYLYAPEKAKAVAPHAYDALDELVLTMPELEPLQDLQQMRSLVIGVRETTQKLPGPMLLGRYYATPDVARIFVNHLTPGLNANRLWALLRIPANALVQAKLSLSFFHAFTVTAESASLEAARGLTAVLRGDSSGATRLAKALAEPVAVIQRGRSIRNRALTTLDPMTLAVDDAVNLHLFGGGRFEQSREYTNKSIQKFTDHLRRANAAFLRQQHGRAGAEVLGAAIRTLPALVEAAAYPILGWLVPTVKVGASTSQVQSELAALPGRPTEATLLAIASKAVNLTDATLGEVVWDNYFLPRALMSAVHMLIMAPGWRGGSAVLLARGLTDPIRRLAPSQRETYRVMVPAGGAGGPGSAPPAAGAGASAPPSEVPLDVKEGYWSPWTSLAIATVLIQVLIAELYQRAHGAGHVQSPMDVAFPRTGQRRPDGKPERVRIPGYAGIFYDILRDVPSSVLDYVLGGTAPLPTAVGQLYHNETVFGEEIVDHTDPWRAQLAEYARFLEEQFAPISVSSYGRRAGTTVEKAESVMGISPAPARVMRTPAEAYLFDRQPPSRRTHEQMQAAEERTAVRQATRTGDTAALGQAAAQGRLSPTQLTAAMRSARRQGFETAFTTAPFTQALKAYALATPTERSTVRALLARKLTNELARTPEADRPRVVTQFQQAMDLPVTAVQ